MSKPRTTELAVIAGARDGGPSVSNLLSLQQSAARLGISVHTVRKLIARGAIPRIKLGRRVLVDPQDLQDFIGRHKETRGLVLRRE